MKLILFAGLLGLTLAYRPLQPQNYKQRPVVGDAGSALFLTPYIESGDIETARELARVVEPLDGLDAGDVVESYAGFFTVTKATDSNMFFWFIPATDVDPLTAPVVIWLQGGPGGSSLFGMLELHGPYQSVYDENGNTVAESNPHAWSKKANVIYIDNPIGAGFSFCENNRCLPTSQDDVGRELYECLMQFFKLFPEYQGLPFFPFGESYAGKFVPTIAKKIDAENPTADIKINLAGLGIGDGFMSPPDSSIYGQYLYHVGLVDDVKLTELLSIEKQMQHYCSIGSWGQCFSEWNREFNSFLGSMGCYYYYGIDICDTPREEDNYEDFVTLATTRKAIHVGDLPFGAQSGDVYYSMNDDFMQSERETIEFLLEKYPVLIYNGNFDIICNHVGVLKMFEAMTSWTGKDLFYKTEQEPYTVGGDTVGYLKTVKNLRLFVMRNAGHMVPRSQPAYSLDMFDKFISKKI